MPEVHAKLSASGAKRWMACTPSANLEQQFPNSTSGYAEEGTFAHSLAELMINYNLGNMTKRVFNTKLNKMKSEELYSQSMQEYVEEYVSKVWEIVNGYKSQNKDVTVLTEQRLDFSKYVPEGFGTGDVVILTDGEVHIIDLKYGKGVAVSAVENPQARLYGLGAIESFGLLYEFDTVKSTIMQPRLEYYTTEELSVEELEAWGNEEVKPLAELAMKGEGEMVAGEHCRFCKARATCRARAESNLELAKLEFKPGELLTNDEIGEVLRKAEQLASWVKDISEYALDQAVNHGVRYDGWKLVEGRSNRKYADDVQVAKTLIDNGYQEEDIYDKKLFGITAMEKIVGKKQLAEILGELIIKPDGKPTLVPESDKRPELNSAAKAAEDFK